MEYTSLTAETAPKPAPQTQSRAVAKKSTAKKQVVVDTPVQSAPKAETKPSHSIVVSNNQRQFTGDDKQTDIQHNMTYKETPPKIIHDVLKKVTSCTRFIVHCLTSEKTMLVWNLQISKFCETSYWE